MTANRISPAELAAQWGTRAGEYRRTGDAKLTTDPIDPQGALVCYSRAAQLDECAAELVTP